jgi:hypothetical protein
LALLQPQPLQPQLGWQLQASPQAQRASAFALGQPQRVFAHWHWVCWDWFMMLTPFGALACALRERDAAPAGALQEHVCFFGQTRDRLFQWQP